MHERPTSLSRHLVCQDRDFHVDFMFMFKPMLKNYEKYMNVLHAWVAIWFARTGTFMLISCSCSAFNLLGWGTMKNAWTSYKPESPFGWPGPGLSCFLYVLLVICLVKELWITHERHTCLSHYLVRDFRVYCIVMFTFVSTWLRSY
jgi:hypothetical protein